MIRYRLSLAVLFLWLCSSSIRAQNPEPAHPILSIPSASSAASILTSWTESQYLTNFVPRVAPRNEDYGFGGAVVSGDTDWSWSTSTPTQIKSMPSGTIFPNPDTVLYPIKTQAVTVMNGHTVNAQYYNRAGSSSKSFVFNMIANHQRGKIHDDFEKLAYGYVNSGNSPATRNDAYARRIAATLLEWAHYYPDYVITGKNSASYINASPSYVLSSDLQRASDHNGLAGEWQSTDIQAFDAIYDSNALATLSTEVGYDARDYIKNNLFFNEGDFIAYHVPVDVAIGSNLSGPYEVLPLVARVLNRPDYIDYMDRYLDATVRQRFQRDGTDSEGCGYSLNSALQNITAAQNTKNYFLTRPADTPELIGISNRASNYVGTLQYGKSQWSTVALPSGELPSFGDTGFTKYYTARNSGQSAMLPAYGHVSMGAGSGNQAVQINQNFPGNNNHMRPDMASFTLYAFNNEMLGNIRYFHIPGRNYDEQLLSHNTVTIDRSNLSPYPDADTYGNGNLTLYESGNHGISLTEIDGLRGYSDKASRYQRIMILNTIDADHPYAVDVFRVTGGKTHDYILHGSIRWDSTWECSLPLTPNPAQYPMLEGSETWSEPNSEGDDFPYYGYWRDVNSGQSTGNFQVTYRDTSTSNRDLRLWATDDGSSTIYLGRTPCAGRPGEDPADFYANWRPSLIQRRRITTGTQQSLFASVIEPMNNGNSTIQSVTRVPILGGGMDAVSIRVTFTNGRADTYLVNLKNSKVAGASTGSDTITTADNQYSLNGRIGMHSTGPLGERCFSMAASSFLFNSRQLTTATPMYSGTITGEIRKDTGGANDAFITNTTLPLGTVLKGKHLSLLFGTLNGSNKTGISQMFEIDHVEQVNGQTYICFPADHQLEINGTTTTEQVAPLRTFSGTNQFQILDSAAAFPPDPVSLEAEDLTSTVSGAAAGREVSDSLTSGGAWISFDADSLGDYIEYTLPNIPAGSYNLKLAYKTNTSRGIASFLADGSAVGGLLDQYASSVIYPEVTIGGVVFASTGNHTIRMTVAGKNASSTGYPLSADKFTLVPNSIPTITSISDQSLGVNTQTNALAFMIGDAETPVNNLTLTTTSSNPAVVPTGNIVFGGSGANRTITVTPTSNQTGSSTITVTVSDGTLTASDSFLVTVTATASQSWRLQYFGTADNTGNAADAFDFDHDGVSNLAEYVLMTDPTKPRGGTLISAKEGTDFTVTYRRLKAALTEVAITCLWAPAAGGPWSNSGVTEQILSDDGTAQIVKARVSATGLAQAFLRLQLTRQ